MTFRQIRLVKRLLALALVGFSALVAQQLYLTRLPSPGVPVPPLGRDPADPLARQVEFSRLDADGRKIFELRAAESIGRSEAAQTFRQVEIRFEAGKERLPLTISADTCHYDTASSAARLEGNVVVSGENSLRIEVERLDYQPGPGRVWTEEPLRFFRRGLEGQASGMVYEVGTASVRLQSQVRARLAPEGDRPIEVQSQWAEFRRRDSLIRFVDEVLVKQENRELRSNDLQLFLTEDEKGFRRMEAYENVEVLLGVPPSPGGLAAGREVPSAAARDRGREAGEKSLHPLGEGGRKRLAARKLEVSFRPGGSSVERVRALEGATLRLEPDPGTDASRGRSGGLMRRQIEANLLAFDFSPDGHLTELRGRGGVTLTLEPVGGPASEIRQVKARQFEAFFDSAMGDLREARCEQAVRFSKGEIRAESESGIYDARNEWLTLTGSPRLRDSRATLEAETIKIGVATGDLEASGKVRANLDSAGTGGLGFFPGANDQAVYFMADGFSYRRSEDIATYTGSARALQGANRIEAERIELRQAKGELEASQGVRTVLLEEDPGKPGAEPHRVMTRSRQLAYRTEDGVLRYRQGVVMKAAGLTLEGQRMDVTTEREGSGAKEILIEGEVEIRMEGSRARGERARYWPGSQEVRVFGEKAILQDGDKLTEGKELTFFLSDDRILVDGREERRTKTVYTPRSLPS